MKVLYILIAVFLSQSVLAADRTDPYTVRLNEETETFVSCEMLEKERLLCERLRIARDRLKDVSLTTFEEREGKRLVRYHEFALVAYDPVEDRFHDIRLAMPKDISKQLNFQPIVRTMSDPPYQVKRLRGQSLNKIVFEIRYGGRELYAYAGKHLFFTEEKLHPLWGGRTVELVDPVVYLATAPYLVNDEFARAGQALFMRAVERAFMELRQSGVRSLAYPDRLLADVVTANEVAHLIVAEQTDPCFLAKRPAGCEHLIPVRPYPNDAVVMQAVNTEFVMNGLAAFRYMRSSASARGSLQFTNNPVKRQVERVERVKGKLITTKQWVTFPGTYDVVQSLYPLAAIDPDFRRGTMSLHNLAKAAAGLIDLELSNRKLPDWVRQAFLIDREFGMPVPGAAYNGGPSQSHRLSQLIEGFAKKHGIDQEDFLFDRFPWDTFLEWVDRAKGNLKPETRGYIEKIIKIRDHLRRHQPPPSEVNLDGVLA
ncbi:MAG: hypothetical protein WAT81_01565 [Candidatus Moraniibacteriota bacterium]